MFNITLKLEPAEATILEVFLRNRGKRDIRRSKIHLESPWAERGTILLEVADQVHQQRLASVHQMRDEILLSLKTPFSGVEIKFVLTNEEAVTLQNALYRVGHQTATLGAKLGGSEEGEWLVFLGDLVKGQRRSQQKFDLEGG